MEADYIWCVQTQCQLCPSCHASGYCIYHYLDSRGTHRYQLHSSRLLCHYHVRHSGFPTISSCAFSLSSLPSPPLPSSTNLNELTKAVRLLAALNMEGMTPDLLKVARSLAAATAKLLNAAQPENLEVRYEREKRIIISRYYSSILECTVYILMEGYKPLSSPWTEPTTAARSCRGYGCQWPSPIQPGWRLRGWPQGTHCHGNGCWKCKRCSDRHFQVSSSSIGIQCYVSHSCLNCTHLFINDAHFFRNVTAQCDDRNLQNKITALMACFKTLAPCIHSPLCQEELIGACKLVAAAAEKIVLTAQVLYK